MMSSVRILHFKMLTVLFLVGCTHEPTPLPVPNGATDVERFSILDGQAFQTQFTLQADYPAAPALSFYTGQIASPWVHCDWGPEWSRFGDVQGAASYTVHQQLHMWVNHEAQRTLMLSMRYRSPDKCCEVPDNSLQHIMLVEYFGDDVEETIKRLELRCSNPGNGP
jgi:hypothetical protein